MIRFSQVLTYAFMRVRKYAVFFTPCATVFMKYLIIPTKSALLLSAALYLCLFLTACQNTVDEPSLSCPEMNMTAAIQGQRSAMNLSSSIIFRQQTDSGGLKFLSMETISDTFKVVLNLTDGLFDEIAIKNDSLFLGTYNFPATTSPRKGVVVAAIMQQDGGDYNFLTTDTSSITIYKINTRTRVLSGKFFFMANNRTVTGEGSFKNACYVSLQ